MFFPTPSQFQGRNHPFFSSIFENKREQEEESGVGVNRRRKIGRKVVACGGGGGGGRLPSFLSSFPSLLFVLPVIPERLRKGGGGGGKEGPGLCWVWGGGALLRCLLLLKSNWTALGLKPPEAGDMGRLWIGMLGLSELLLSTTVHVVYGFYIFSTGVASDLSQALTGRREERQPGARHDGCSVPPIVLVHGIFGFGKGRLGGLSYFGGAEKKDDRVLVPDLGSLTSIYDRARELFYYLKGGQVDYGEEHSRRCGHSRFGRVYEPGHYPAWDDHHPVHLVGHSAGVQVIRVLQQMLADKSFEGYENTSEDWVLSVTSLSGALNGTTRTYLDGMLPDDGKSMKPICLLQLCRLGCIVYDWLDIKWLKNYYNFGFDHFDMAWHKAGVLGLVDCLLGNGGPFASGDWILPDLTIQGTLQLNFGLRTFPNTYYFSYATRRTRKLMGVTLPSSVLGIHPMLFIRVLQMSQWRHPPDVPPPYKGYRDEDWEDNDGALNTISMTHPRLPTEHPSHFVVDDSECHPMLPGLWYYKILEADHIFFILNRDRAGVQFDLMYDSIFQRCRKHAFRTAPPPTLPNQVPP